MLPLKKVIDPRTAVLLGLISFAGIWRLLIPKGGYIPFENFTPMGAMALFGGCYFVNKWKAFLCPLFALFVSDMVIMRLFYPEHSAAFLYEGWLWVYGAFTLIVLLGHCIKKVSVISVFVSALAASLLHWLISDFGVWIGGGLDISTGLPFTKDLGGLLKCYTLALPFLKNTLIGNLVFSAIMFGAFELVQARFPVLSVSKGL